MPRRWIRSLKPAILALSLACGSPADSDPADAAAAQAEVAAALQRYMIAARAVDPGAIAAFFAPGATLFEPGINPIHTRDSIRAFMGSFPGVRVDSASATPDTIEVWGNKAFLWGSYFERLAFPGQPQSVQHGKFVMEWVRGADGTWLIERFFRVPIPSPQ